MKRIQLICCLCVSFSFVHAQITVDFLASGQEGCEELLVNFFDQSYSDAGPILEWEWSYQLGASNLQNPGVIFNDVGSYEVCLTVIDSEGNSEQLCKEDYIIIHANPIPAFLPDLLEGCSPLSVQFEDVSSSEGDIITWIWDLGGTSNVIETSDPLLNIATTYNNEGSYSLSLTVIDEHGCSNTTLEPNLINVASIAPFDVSLEHLSSCALPWIMNFNVSDAEENVDYIWNFGNGQSAEGDSIFNINFDELGQFDLEVIASTGVCTDTFYFDNFVNTNPLADFTVSTNTLCSTEELILTDISEFPADSILWNFGNGSFSSDSPAQYIFPNPGEFLITLIRYHSGCSDTIVSNQIIEVLETPEIEVLIENSTACEFPHMVSLLAQANSEGTIVWIINNEEFEGESIEYEVNDYGSYPVEIQFVSDLGCIVNQVFDPIYISRLEASLPYFGPMGCAPLDFTLSDSIVSNDIISSYEWSINTNPPLSSTDPNPSFTVLDTGLFDLQLIVTNEYGCKDTIIAADYIKSGMAPEVDFTVNPKDTCARTTRFFESLVSAYTTEWFWQFGNDTSSIEENPEISFNSIQSLDVTLTVSHYGCSSTLEKEDFIQLWAPTAKFSKEYNCDNPYLVNLTDLSEGADSISWVINIPGMNVFNSQDSILNYTFPDRGNYAVNLSTYNFQNGCTHYMQDTIRITDPEARFNVDTTRVCFPGEIFVTDASIDAQEYLYSNFDGNFNNATNPNPVLSFDVPGAYASPWLIITDIHECQDTFILADTLFVNAVTAIPIYEEVICVPSEGDFTDGSQSIFGELISWSWNIGNGFHTSEEPNTSVDFTTVNSYDLSFEVVDSWSCKDVFFEPDAIETYTFSIDFSRDSIGCSWGGIQFDAITDSDIVSQYFWDFGDGQLSNEKDPFHYYTDEGFYNVCLTIESTNGCFKKTCIDNALEVINPLAQFSADPISATCPPLLTSFENQSLNTIDYIWNFGDNSGMSNLENPSHVYTAPGSYDITLIASMNDRCKDTLLIEDFIQIYGPEADFEVLIDSSCLPVSIQLQANSNDEYIYVWDFGDGVLDSIPGLVNSNINEYTYDELGLFTPRLIVSDTAGCTRSFSGDPIPVNNIEIDFSVTDGPHCGTPVDVIVSNQSGGSNPIDNFSWFVSGVNNYESSEENPVFTFSDAGSYSIQLVANIGYCKDSLTLINEIIVGEYPALSFIPSTNLVCEETSIEIINQSTPLSSTTWEWDFGNGQTAFDESPEVNYEDPGEYTIRLVGTSPEGCISELEQSVEILENAAINAGSTELICQGESIELVGNIFNPALINSFYWVIDPELSCSNCVKTTATPLDTSIYYLVAIHNNGCQQIDSVIVNLAPVPVPELILVPDTSICLRDTILLSIENPNTDYQYDWSGIDFICVDNCNSIQAFPLEPTSYSILATNQYGCQSETSINVDIETMSPPILQEDKTICEFDSIQIQIENGNNPVWESNVNLSCLTCENPIANPTITESYYVTIESDLGCSYKDTIQVEVIPEGLTNAGINDTICFGDRIELMGIGFGESQWTPSSYLSDPNILNPSAQPEQTITYVLENQQGSCVQKDSVQITVLLKAEIEALGDNICPGDVAFLNASGVVDNYTWYNEEDLVIGNENELYIYPESTSNFSVIGSYGNCALDTAYVSVTVYDNIDIKLELDVDVYANLPYEFNIQYDESKDYIFQWSPPDGLSCNDCPNPVISDLSESIEYELTVFDPSTGCQIDTIVLARYINECTEKAFYVPNIFSPNGDGNNDGYRVFAQDEDEFLELYIYDRWGELMFDTKDISEKWDGLFQNKNLDPAVFAILINAFCKETGEPYHFYKDVTIAR